MKVIIDRFVGRFAVVELDDRKTVDLPIELVPADAAEGDILEIIVNKEETEDRKTRIEKMCEDLWE